MTDRQPNVAALREEYLRSGLSEAEAGDDPIALFDRWLREAIAVNTGPSYSPVTMTLATVSPSGEPAARILLLKGADERGFTFFTNYRSHKARDLEANPRAAMVFHWAELERQVRVAGPVEKVSRAESDAYFVTRPRGSQLGAWVSDQSERVTRAELDARLAELEERYAGRTVECPPHWGGYLLRPMSVEFWQGRENRLHDRILFRRTDAASPWTRERLGP